MRVALLGFIVLFSFPLFAQAKHPFTFEDMMALKRVEEPVVSPDGKWVLFAVVDVDLKANTKTPHVWVVPLNQDKAGSSARSDHSPANDPAPPGMTESKEREIISDQDADRPRWAPDGKRFAFISTKENGSQIWIADFDGSTGIVTAKHQLTNIPTEADGEVWSPDGKNILFKSDVWPECDGIPAEETACNAKRVEEGKTSKVKALIFTHLLYRHWNAYREGKRTHLLVVAADSQLSFRKGQGYIAMYVQYLDLTPGDYDAPVFSLGGQDDYAFSPDGQEICYASNHDPEPAISTNNDLFTVPVHVGAGDSPAQVLAATKDITAENKAADNSPLYSPDGKYIAYRAQQRPGYESDRWRLMLYDRKTGDRGSVTEGFDLWVGTYVWSRDSKRVYFSYEEAGRAPVMVLLGPGSIGAPITEERGPIIPTGPLIQDGYNDDLVLALDGQTLLFTRMSISTPNEIYTSPAAGKCKELPPSERGTGASVPCEMPKAVALTHVNEAVLSRIKMSPVQTFSFKGAYDDKIQGFLVKPPNFDPNKKYPVKFIVHGGPEVPMGDEWTYRWNAELFAADGYVVIEINFHGSPGYGQKFIDAINGDWGGAPYEDLMKGLDYAEQHYPFIDKDRECALGASFGGYMVNWIMGHTNRFKCIVSHDGTFNTESDYGTTEELWFNEWEFKGTPWTNLELYRKWSPHLFAKNFKTPTLVVHGQLDYRLDVSEGFQLFTTLQRLGVPSKMLYFPDEGHWVLKPQNSQLWYKTVNDWVDQWIGKPK
jgi:dipeptidyl aminopeptidase/acylaminoacyl peptidase